MDVARSYPRTPLFGEKVKKSMIEEIIGELRLFDRTIERPEGEDPRPPLLTFLLEKRHITEKDLEEAVHSRLIEAGGKMVDVILKSEDYADFLGSLPVLGYAMKFWIIHPEEYDKLHFDHGDTPQGVIRSSEGLNESVVKQLLTPYEKPCPYEKP